MTRIATRVHSPTWITIVLRPELDFRARQNTQAKNTRSTGPASSIENFASSATPAAAPIHATFLKVEAFEYLYIVKNSDRYPKAAGISVCTTRPCARTVGSSAKSAIARTAVNGPNNSRANLKI